MPGGRTPGSKNGDGWVDSDGYHRIGQRCTHVLIAEKALGKPLPEGAEIHHFDGDRLNNSSDNLVICPDSAYHKLLHKRQRALEACGHADWLRCNICKEYSPPKTLVVDEKNSSQYHRECRRLYQISYRALKGKNHG